MAKKAKLKKSEIISSTNQNNANLNYISNNDFNIFNIINFENNDEISHQKES